MIKRKLLVALHSCIMVAVLVFAAGCKKQESTASAPAVDRLPRASRETEDKLNQEFPGMMSSPEFTDSLLHFLGTKYGIEPHNMLLGASTCVDDIIYTKNFRLHPEIKGPFHLGGLAGLPFTGKSGLEAFAHHVPEGGTMVLIVEPHIGYSEEAGWGYVLRHEQHESTSCCGALMGTLEKLQKGTLTGNVIEDDYQGGKIAELALRCRGEILEAKNPIVALTKITSRAADEQILKHFLGLDKTHIKYIVIITGVLINTDYQFADYQFCDHIMVYDVAQRKFVEDLRAPAVVSEQMSGVSTQ